MCRAWMSLLIVRQGCGCGYAPDLADNQVIEISQNPFHIGYALVEPTAPVVTAEVSAPSE
jgi:hypothetical protein